MRRLASLIAVVGLAGCDLDLDGLGGCSDRREFSDEISATGLTTLLVDAEDGDLRVVGRAGINEVRVHARACSNDHRTTDDLDFQLYRSGGGAQVTAFMPTRDNARIDLTIEVPADFDVEIYDTSGHMDIRNVYFVWVDDLSGDIDVQSIETDVVIDEDGSGDIDVEDVGGDFIVGYDSSGSIRHRNVRGRVQLP